MSHADLEDANLGAADLSAANLTGTNLMFADLNRSRLGGANLAQAVLGATTIGLVDLSETLGLATVNHVLDTDIAVRTLVASVRRAAGNMSPELTAFFRGAGVPPALLDALPAIVAEVKYHSCFISYGQPDVELAKKLCQDLEASGVPCWLYDMDKTVGKRTWGEIEQKLGEYERMVVLCSIDALLRDGVKKEIDKQIDKSPDKLVPVSLDNRWTQRGFKAEWGDRDLKTWLIDKNYADFANKPYEEALAELLKGLRRPAVKKPRRKKG
jgi:hypothetical protein